MADGRRVDAVRQQVNPPPPLTQPPPLPPPPRVLASQAPPPPLTQPPPHPPPPRAFASQAPPPPLTQPPPLPPPPRVLASQALPPPLTQPPPRPPPPRAQPPQAHPPPVSALIPEQPALHSKPIWIKDNKGGDDDDRRTLGKRPAGTIKMNLKQQSGLKKKRTDSPSEKPEINKHLSKSVVAAFGSDSDDEEDMPAEAKMRMRNVGKNTPTSAGPNSFNKSRSGFADPRGSWRNELTD